MKTVAVIGAGASGMMAAITAARNGAKVILFEQNDRVGKKILATGNGKCNFANETMDDSCYHSETEGFAKAIIENFDVKETITFFEELGLCVKNRNGYLYPLSEQATAVLDILRIEMKRLFIKSVENRQIKKIERKITKDGNTSFLIDGIYADKVICACGSKASVKKGFEEAGYSIAKQFGHRIIKPLPALVALHCEEKFFKLIAGVRMDACVTLIVNGKKMESDRGEVQLTDYGISGIPVFQISRNAVRSLAEKKSVEVKLDLLPVLSKEDIALFLKNRLHTNSFKSAEEFLYGLFPKKVILMLLKEAKIAVEYPVSKIGQEQLEDLFFLWKAFPLKVIGSNSFEQAQICSGGVDAKELYFSLESKKESNLYFVGEMVDVDGKCGGYNLQWAWSSGYVAGRDAATK